MQNRRSKDKQDLEKRPCRIDLSNLLLRFCTTGIALALRLKLRLMKKRPAQTSRQIKRMRRLIGDPKKIDDLVTVEAVPTPDLR